MAVCLPGNLSVLPLELFWQILDQLLTENPAGTGPTHDNICTLGKLVHTHKDIATSIEAYFSGGTANKRLREAVQSDIRFPYRSRPEADLRDGQNDRWTVAENYTFETSTGLVTNIVKDDCPSCFMLLRKLLPDLELDGTWITDKWTLFFIAIHYGSLKMIKYFCSIETSNGSCIPLLNSPADAMSYGGPSMLETILLDKDPLEMPEKQFVRDFFTFLIPQLHELNTPGNEGEQDGPNLEARYYLCQFLTVEQAVEFDKAGMPLYDARESWPIDVNAYHAAVRNGPEFLEYVHQNTSLPMIVYQDHHPIHTAVEANRLDSIIWLQANGDGDKYHFQHKPQKMWKETAAYQAALRTSEESIEILKELLRPLDADKFSPTFCPFLLHTVVRGLGDDQRNAEEDEEYKLAIVPNEARAIQKCEYIISKFAKDPCGSTQAKDKWDNAASRAREAGFNDLLACIEAGMPSDSGDRIEPQSDTETGIFIEAFAVVLFIALLMAVFLQV